MRPSPLLAVAVSVLSFAAAARADEAAPPLPAPTGAAQPTTTVQAPSGGGLTVIAPVAGGGTLTAVGCSAVSVSGHSTEVRPGGPAVAAGAPCPVAAPAPLRPRYAPDSGRKAAIITSPILYGLGATIAGVSYLTHNASCSDNEYGPRYQASTGHCDSAKRALWAYGAISAGVPSLPRWVVGDVGRALAFSGARAGSIAAAALIDWGSSSDSWMGPFFFGFGAPVALAVVDMATTPHREDLEDRSSDKAAPEPEPQRAHDQAKAIAPRITAIAPSPVGDREHRAQGGAVTLAGTF